MVFNVVAIHETFRDLKDLYIILHLTKRGKLKGTVIRVQHLAGRSSCALFAIVFSARYYSWNNARRANIRCVTHKRIYDSMLQKRKAVTVSKTS